VVEARAGQISQALQLILQTIGQTMKENYFEELITQGVDFGVIIVADMILQPENLI